ncbi:enhancer of mRNA-decapping protein 4 [Aristolochia californica]|uniref:enhancer of mRNA-decapping protein 4 n=1 Tax=Aristolochia californica TaxID=171875 RepID=UPI0035D7078B
MASAGNPNQPTPFDVQKFFKPPSPNPNPNNPPTPFSPPSSYSPPPTSYSAPPTGPFSYPPQTAAFHHYLPYPPQEPHPNARTVSYPTPPSPSPNLNPNPGARLMALLGNSPSPNVELPSSSMGSSSEFSLPQSNATILPAVPSAPPIPQPSPARLLSSSKAPKGRNLYGAGKYIKYDIDVRLPGESQPQLEVTPITKYVSDPALVLGRQIAVNRTYICYGLKLGAIRVLNINTALRALLRGHTQRVTDMAFFAEEVHLLASASIDGRVFVWKIDEGPDKEDKPQIAGNIVIAIQIVGDGESFHPRICWHCHKQEILVVGIGKRVLRIDTTKIGKSETFSAEEPLKCPIEKLIDGVQFVGKHDGEVTDLSMCQWMTTRLVSASTDGTVKIWEDRKSVPLATLRPHDGQPVNSATFLTCPNRPDHIVLITAGHLNREVKIWASASWEGWLLPSDVESWQCIKTLELTSSSESRPEEAFFNQVVVLPRAGLILLANAKKNAIYAVHLDYGLYPSVTIMDYLSEFTVTMPILSLTGTSDSTPGGDQIVQVYCVQTQAIQQYALNLSQCMASPLLPSDPELAADLDNFLDASEMQAEMDQVHEKMKNVPDASKPPSSVLSGGLDLAGVEVATSSSESKQTPATTVDSGPTGSSIPLPLSPQLSGKLSGLRTMSNGFDQSPEVGDQPVVDRRVDAVHANLPDIPPLENSQGGETEVGQNNISVVPTLSVPFKHPTHLITPSEILCMAVSSSEKTEVQDVVVNKDVESVEVEVKVVGETGSTQHEEFETPDGNKEKAIYTQNQVPYIDSARTEIVNEEETCHVSATSEAFEPPSNASEEAQETSKSSARKVLESTPVSEITQSPSVGKGKKQKSKPAQVLGPSSSISSFNSTDSSTEPGPSSSIPTLESAFSQLLTMQETLNQISVMQKEMQKQMSTVVAAPVTKEGRRVETALGRSMEKTVKANIDALWARLQEENAKHEKVERERVQQISSSISNFMNKDLPAILERLLKKELSAVGPAVARAINPVLEKAISAAIAESFQRGVGDKAVGQLEKSVSSKLEATVARQIQGQFQTSGKQALQDALRSSLESSVIPAFEMSCKAMFEQVDTAFQKGMAEHTTAAHQQFESVHSPLVMALRDAINSASSMTQTLTGELADGQRRFLALAANPEVVNSSGASQGKRPLTVLQVDPPLDPTQELQRLVSERKFGEAFTEALQRSDVSIVSWLCSQVDLLGILTMVPLPLSQGVLLALLQQLSCDLVNETPRKLEWMRDVALAINPVDPTIALHIRPIFEQVYQILGHHRSLPIITPAEATNVRLVMHVINSVLMGCK